jgi:hypothetical protein
MLPEGATYNATGRRLVQSSEPPLGVGISTVEASESTLILPEVQLVLSEFSI